MATTHLCVLPADVMQQVVERVSISEQQDSGLRPRFLRLPHPRTGLPCLFLATSTTSTSPILELQSIEPPNPRSWFLPSDEHVVQDGKLLLMTPIDPAFLLIPLLHLKRFSVDSEKFTTLDDVFEMIINELRKIHPAPDHSDQPKPDYGTTIETVLDETMVADIWALSAMPCVQAAMRTLCEFKEITSDIAVYRYSPSKTLEYLRIKASRLATSSALSSSRTVTRSLARDGLMDDGKESLLEPGRLRAACDMISQYLPRNIYAELMNSYDFNALNAHLKTIQDRLVAEANAAAASAGAGKQPKKTKAAGSGSGEKKRKSQDSKGVEKLKKANIKGMATISSFFKSNPA